MTFNILDTNITTDIKDLQIKQSNDLSNYLDSFFKQLQINELSKMTYKRGIKNFFLFLLNRQITQPKKADVVLYINTLLKELKPTTVQSYFMAIRQLFKWLESEGLYKNITLGVKGINISKQFKKDYLSEDQVKLLLDFDTNSIKGKRDYAILLLMISTGLRTIEVIRANVGDLTTRGKNTVLYIQGKGHFDKDDFVIVPFEVEKCLREYLATRKKVTSDSPLFVSISNNNTDKEITTRALRQLIKNRLVNAGFDSERYTAHSLRHTAITLSLCHGNTLQETKAFARHQCIATTLIYAHNLDLDNNKCSSSIVKAILKN